LPSTRAEVLRALDPFPEARRDRATYALGCKALLAIGEYRRLQALARRGPEARRKAEALREIPDNIFRIFLALFLHEKGGRKGGVNAALDRAAAEEAAVSRALARLRRGAARFLSQPTVRGRPPSPLPAALLAFARDLATRHGRDVDDAEAAAAEWASRILGGRPSEATIRRDLRELRQTE
jgi:hypothetical protein